MMGNRMSDTDDLLIYHVELSDFSNGPHYVVVAGDGEIEDAPGEAIALRGKMMPSDVFESVAAQYDIDPEAPGGWDELLLLVLGPAGEEDRSVEQELDDPNHIYNAPSVAHAREARLGRARKALGTRKLRGVPGVSEHKLLANEAVRIAESSAEDPLEFIKRTAPMSPEHIAVKREHMRRARIQIRARRLGLDPSRGYTPQELERHEKIRAMKKEPVRETADQLAIKLLGAPLDHTDDDRLPPRNGQPSKYL